MKDVFHPNLSNSPNLIKNSITLGKIILEICITGPNASGKSVFMKTVIVNLILSQSLGISFSKNVLLLHLIILIQYLIFQIIWEENLFEAQILRILKFINESSKTIKTILQKQQKQQMNLIYHF